MITLSTGQKNKEKTPLVLYHMKGYHNTLLKTTEKNHFRNFNLLPVFSTVCK